MDLSLQSESVERHSDPVGSNRKQLTGAVWPNKDHLQFPKTIAKLYSCAHKQLNKQPTENNKTEAYKIFLLFSMYIKSIFYNSFKDIQFC